MRELGRQMRRAGEFLGLTQLELGVAAQGTTPRGDRDTYVLECLPSSAP
jgi:hypothetical protein